MENLRYRQVHLDFHTSPELKDIGKLFNEDKWCETLENAHVDSITLFSKCHHGYSYHETKVNEMHPHLDFDLLDAQIKACKKINVKTPIYISAGIDEKEAIRHPEWLIRGTNEETTWVNGFTNVAGFHLLCFNTDYLKLLLNQIEEVLVKYSPEAIFLDIAGVVPCYCHKCRADIFARNEDISDQAIVMKQAELVYQNYTNEVEKLVRKYSKDCRIFHNAGHISRGRRDLTSTDTHLELESLPTGGWGYDHFPLSAAYVMNLGKEYLGMTGKFHNAWGEFGGFKHPNALLYETGLSLAFGARCSIGDQLHPLGFLEKDSYDLIANAYKEVKAKEKWCISSEAVVDIAVLGDEVMNSSISNRDIMRYSDIGANRILLEGKYLYSFIDLECDFSKYKLIILPDSIRLDEKLKERLNSYLSSGGKILASGRSGLYKDKDIFAIDFGCTFEKVDDNNPNYILPAFKFSTGTCAHIMYSNSYDIKINPESKFEILAHKQSSYFNRSIYRFCSHQHSPNDINDKKEAIIINKNSCYIAWDIFSDYAKKVHYI